MTREELYKAAKLKLKDSFCLNGKCIYYSECERSEGNVPPRKNSCNYDFALSMMIKGIDLAINSWISVDDDLPCNHDELILYGSSTKVVLVSDHQGCIGLLRMKKRSNGIIGAEPWWQWEIPAVIYYWMPIQELPKE